MDFGTAAEQYRQNLIEGFLWKLHLLSIFKVLHVDF